MTQPGGRGWRVAAGAVLAVVAASGLVPGAPAAPAGAGGSPVIQTVAGGNGQGPALAVSEVAGALTVSGSTLYVADGDGVYHVVRAVNLTTGQSTVVAGTGGNGWTGDGGPATQAELGRPVAVAADTFGDLFISDSINSVVRKVDAGGTITTIAGNGSPGFGGDGGPASAAQLDNPQGLVADSQGNLYIADRLNFRVRRVDHLTGTITTVAGTGLAGYSGDGGPATSANMSGPWGLSLDGAGDLYLADTNNLRVRKVDSTGKITTVAGNGLCCFAGDNGPSTSASLDDPHGIAVDAAGNLYIADAFNNRVRRVAASGGTVTNGTITTVAGVGSDGFSGDGGPAKLAKLRGPDDIAFAADGSYFVVDHGNARIRKVDTALRISTVAGNGLQFDSGDGRSATAAQLSPVRDVTVDAAGDLFIADSQNSRVRRVDATSGVVTTVAGTGVAGYGGDGGAATAAKLKTPDGVALDSSGDLFIGDTGNNRVRRVDAATGVITTVAGSGVAGYSGDGGAATAARLKGPQGLALDAGGNLFVADTTNSRIRRIDASTRVITTVAGSRLAGYSGDGGPATAAKLRTPNGVSLDSSGNLYIADTANNRVRRVAGGVITTVAGNGTAGYTGDGGPATLAQLAAPEATIVTAAGLVISDSANNVVRVVDGTGHITTLAGTGEGDYSGDGGPPDSATLNAPGGLAVDPTGTVLEIADAHNGRIRAVLDFAGTAGPAVALRLSGLPARSDVSVADSATVTAVDAAGNVATGYQGTATLSSSDSAAVLPSAYTFQPADNGVHAFGGIVFLTAGVTSRLSATGPHLSGSGSAQSTVYAPASISVTPAAPSVAAGSTVQFSAEADFSDGVTAPGDTYVSWSSSGPAATISGTGLATGRQIGSATIGAVLAGTTGSATVAVTGLSSTTTASSNGPVPAGTAATLTVTVTGAGSAFPTGSVTVTDSGNNAVGSATLAADGSGATVSLDPGLPPGQDVLTVSYSSDGTYLASSAQVTQEVDP